MCRRECVLGSSLALWAPSSMGACVQGYLHTRVHSYAEVLGAGPGLFLRSLLMRV